MQHPRTLFPLVFLSLLFAASAYPQGCIVARSGSMDMSPESQGGYLQPGDWDFTIGYRHQFSYKHFIGDVEQTQRVAPGTQVMNKINLEDVNISTRPVLPSHGPHQHDPHGAGAFREPALQ